MNCELCTTPLKISAGLIPSPEKMIPKFILENQLVEVGLKCFEAKVLREVDDKAMQCPEVLPKSGLALPPVGRSAPLYITHQNGEGS